MSIELAIIIWAIIIAFPISKISKRLDALYEVIYNIFQIMWWEVKSTLEKSKSTEILWQEIWKIYKNRYKVDQEKANTWWAQRINAEWYEKAVEILQDSLKWPIFDRDIMPNKEQSFKKGLDEMIENERKDK